jgi:phosphate:Na+ symporter
LRTWIAVCALLAVPGGGLLTGGSHAAERTVSANADSVALVRLTCPADRHCSGDGQFASAGSKLERALAVRLLRHGRRPVTNEPVYFTVISAPAGSRGARIEPEVATTGDDGVARAFVTLGSEPGTYVFAASIPESPRGIVAFEAVARSPRWAFFVVIGLAGGLGLFLYGLNSLSHGMRRTAGSRLRSILGTVTHNRLVAVCAGALVTTVVQSSSATTVMLVSLVQAQMMSLVQTMGLILGADIGTTITVQLIAIEVTDIALVMVAAGAMLMLMKKHRVKDAGETIFGLGLVFYGLHVMSQSMAPLKTYEPFLDLLLGFEHPLLGFAAGALFTALIQSSSAFIGILIALARPELLTLEAAIPLLLGANVGTSITGILAALNARREAQRVALAHTLFKVAGAAIFIWWIPQYAEFIRSVSVGGGASAVGLAAADSAVPRQIANAHTVFNLALTAIFLPFTHVAAKVFTLVLPDREEIEREPFKTRYLNDSMIATPALALNLAKNEVLRIGEIVIDAVDKIVKPFVDRDERVLDEIDLHERRIDFLTDKVSDYLRRVGRQQVAEERVNEVFQMMYTTTELELMADIVHKTLRPRAKAWLESDLEFSAEGKAEILDYHVRSLKQISRALEVFKDLNLEKAEAMKRKHKKYRSLEMDFMRTHYERLRRDVPQAIATTEIHQDLIEQFARITSHATNIARMFLEWKPGGEHDHGKRG